MILVGGHGPYSPVSWVGTARAFKCRVSMSPGTWKNPDRGHRDRDLPSQLTGSVSNALVLTEAINSRIGGKPELINCECN